MKKVLTDEELVALARLAPVVSVKITKGHEKRGSKIFSFDSVEKFLELTNLETGRYPIPVSVLYDCYCIIADNPMKKHMFYKKFNTFVKQNTSDVYKMNMMPITLMKLVKEIKNEKENKEK